MKKRKSVSEELRDQLAAEIASGKSMRTIEKECGVFRQTLTGFMRGEIAVRSTVIDALAEKYQLELRPIEQPKKKKKKKGGRDA